MASGMAESPTCTEPLGSLNLLWFDPDELFRGGFRNVASEVENFFQKIGVKAVWNSAAGVEEDGQVVVLVILIPHPPSGWRLRDDVVGAAPGVGGPRRFAYVFPPRIMRALGREFSTDEADLVAPNAELVKSTSRITIHEIIHAVAPTHRHSSGGLMKASQGRDAWLEDEVLLDETCRRAFLSALATF